MDVFLFRISDITKIYKKINATKKMQFETMKVIVNSRLHHTRRPKIQLGYTCMKLRTFFGSIFLLSFFYNFCNFNFLVNQIQMFDSLQYLYHRSSFIERNIATNKYTSVRLLFIVERKIGCFGSWAAHTLLLCPIRYALEFVWIFLPFMLWNHCRLKRVSRVRFFLSHSKYFRGYSV